MIDAKGKEDLFQIIHASLLGLAGEGGKDQKRSGVRAGETAGLTDAAEPWGEERGDRQRQTGGRQ